MRYQLVHRDAAHVMRHQEPKTLSMDVEMGVSRNVVDSGGSDIAGVCSRFRQLPPFLPVVVMSTRLDEGVAQCFQNSRIALLAEGFRNWSKGRKDGDGSSCISQVLCRRQYAQSVEEDVINLLKGCESRPSTQTAQECGRDSSLGR